MKITDNTAMDKNCVTHIQNFADKLQITLSVEQIGSLLLNNTEDSLRLCSWFKAEFDLMGDPQPNRLIFFCYFLLCFIVILNLF